MPARAANRYVLRRDHTRPPVAWMLFLALLSIPMFSLYLGYVLGQSTTRLSRGPPEKALVVAHPSHLNKSLQWTSYLTAELEGGLGSRMFIYASLYGLASMNSMHPVLAEDTHFSNVFPGLDIESTDDPALSEGWPIFRELYTARFDKRATRLNYERNIHLVGRYQSWKYFHHLRDKLRLEFQFAHEIDGDAEAFLQSARHQYGMPNENLVFVGIQVRRGNFARPELTSRGYTTATSAYIQNAMDYFLRHYHNVIFVVATDDVMWTRQHITHGGLGVKHVPSGPASVHMAILSKCNHSIITVGAFGWWAAWLAGGRTVYYRKFPLKGSLLDASFRSEDYYPPDWISMI